MQKYAIAEFDIPYSASRAKKALDQIENSMKPDQNKRGGGANTQVKLLRSEFAAIKSVQAQFSKILFVSNLPPVRQLQGVRISYVFHSLLRSTVSTHLCMKTSVHLSEG